MICKLSLPLLFLRTVNTVTHSYDTSAVLPQLLFEKHRQYFGRVFKFLQFFFAQCCAKFHDKTSEWTECFKEILRIYLILDSQKIPLNFLPHFYSANLTFVPVYCCAVVPSLRKLHEQELLWFGINVSQH